MLVHPLNICFFAIVLRLSFLISFVNNKYALAINTGPNEESSGDAEVPEEQSGDSGVSEDTPAAPDVLTYPSIDDIRLRLRRNTRTATRTTVVLAITQPENVAAFFRYTTQPGYISIFQAFPPGYLTRKGPDDEVSQKLFEDFYNLCNIEFLKQAQGDVEVMTDDGKAPGPDNCGYFVNHEANILRANELAKNIDFVKATDPSVRTRYQSRLPGDLVKTFWPVIPAGLGAVILEKPKVQGLIKSKWKALSHLLDDSIKKEPEPGVKTDVLNSPTAALPPPVNSPVSEDELSVIPTSGDTSSVQGSSLTDGTSDTESATKGTPGTSEPDQGLGTGDTTQMDDKMAYDANSDPSSLFQGRRRGLRRRELRRRASDQCTGWLISASDYFATQSQSQAAEIPDATNPAPPPQLDGAIPNAMAYIQKDSSSFATVQVTQHAKGADGIYPLDISILNSNGEEINNMQNQKAPPGTEIEVQVPWDTQLPPDSPLFMGPKNHPLYVSTGPNPEDALKFRYADPELASLGPPDFGLTFESNDEKHSCVVGAWIDSKRDVKCSFTVYHL